MKIIPSLRRHHYVARVSIFLITVALIAGMVGCGGGGGGGGGIVEYSLTMAVTPGGSGTATDLTNASPYTTGTSVSIEAVANTGYRFVNWAAPAGTFASVNAEQTTFTMPAQNVTVAASFEEDVLVTFVDYNLEIAVRQAIAKPEDPIYARDMERLIYLDAEYGGISDLSGLKYATRLTQLSLWRNQISDISPLANLTRLTGLDLEGNRISDISPLANLTNLTWLDLDDNQISDIFPLANLTGLIWLDLDNNQISDISPLVENEGLGPGDVIGLSGNPLNPGSINIHIPQLEARGVDVHY